MNMIKPQIGIIRFVAFFFAQNGAHFSISVADEMMRDMMKRSKGKCEEEKMTLEIQQSFDMYCRRNALIQYTKSKRDALIIGYVFMVYINVDYELIKDIILYHEPVRLDTILFNSILILYVALLVEQYRLIKYKKMGRFLKTLFLLRYHLSTVDQLSQIKGRYGFGPEEFVVLSTYDNKLRRRPYRKIRKLYMTDDYIFESRHMYIERTAIPEEDFVKLQQFLEGKVPKKYIYHVLA